MIDKNIIAGAPTEEPARQQYFMEQVKKLVEAESAKKGRPLTCFINTFGCQMNARDSEKLLGILKEAGYVEGADENSDFVLYNTCTVRENANLKVYGRLGYLSGVKRKNPDMMIALCGCMMQEPEVVAKIKKSYRHVDLIFGTHNIFKLAELLYERFMEKKMVVDVWEGTNEIVEELPVERKYPFKSGVNIMFGCNNFCSYCIVPYVRGRERSREPEDIIKEIEELVADGVVEVMLLGQNVNSYGKNLEHPITFAELLRRVEKIEGLERIRFMTSHPKDLSDELIETMRDSKKICSHLHLPLQSGSSEILKRMNRKYSKEQYLALVEKLRAAIPDISLTTDIIVLHGIKDRHLVEIHLVRLRHRLLLRGRAHLGNLFCLGCDIGARELLNKLLRAGDHRLRNTREFRDLDSVALICPALYDLSEEYDIIPLFLDGDTIVVDTADGPLKFRELMIMGRKQRLRAEDLRVADVFDDCPGDRETVKGTRAAANLIEDEETVFRGIS